MNKSLSITCTLLLLFCASCNQSKQKDFPEKPNFIILFTDDQRYDALGYAGNKNIITPNLDELCSRGVYFSQACVATSICSPSRAALMTGRFGSSNGVVSVGRNPKLDPGEKTLFEYLQEARYLTGHTGKWHLTDPPDSCGFSFSALCRGNGTYYGREFFVEGQADTAFGFIEDYIVDQSIAFMNTALDREMPFALFHCTQLPHMDHNYDWDVRESTQEIYRQMALEPPPNWKDDLTGKPAYLASSRSRQRALYYGYADRDSLINHLERYYASITEMDEALGRLFGYLEQQGLDQHTFILYMSDNGWFLGDHNFTSKVLAYEASVRVPFAITGPGILPGKSDALVLNVDIAPTVMELAGLDLPGNMQGASLLPLLTGEKDPVREEIYYEAPETNLGSYPLFAIRTRDWKYIRTYDNEEPSRLIFEELYDLKTDPHEMLNLCDKPEFSTQMASLSGKLDVYRQQIK